MIRKRLTRPNIVLFSMLTVICLLEILKLILLSNLSVDTIIYAKQVEQLKDQEAANEELRAQILANQSLTVIATKAASMGLVEAQKEYLGSDGKLHVIKTASQ